MNKIVEDKHIALLAATIFCSSDSEGILTPESVKRIAEDFIGWLEAQD